MRHIERCTGCGKWLFSCTECTVCVQRKTMFGQIQPKVSIDNVTRLTRLTMPAGNVARARKTAIAGDGYLRKYPQTVDKW